MENYEDESDQLIICRLLASSALVYKFSNSIISLNPDTPYLPAHTHPMKSWTLDMGGRDDEPDDNNGIIWG